MAAFRILLIILFLELAIYTVFTVSAHGLNFYPDYFGDMLAMGWPGQFNLDFTCLLVLGALWIAWREGFALSGLAIAVAIFFGGALVLTAYLLIASFRAKGDPAALLLGATRAAAR
ncbi:hypothetical protein [Parasphingopyxis marina]|uniref:DUF1475 domain-containing protein n=1 Tax=Parasphingopyxis marina TaxID=2761622 RepID=A0A842HWI2_9SPHN|nr:hypothetical protein [Parasphingopyxis marina]MBC2777255.1 hypothetical protein [Parasphingopyxis marina]